MMWLGSGIGWRLAYQFLFQSNAEDGISSTLDRLAAKSFQGNVTMTLLCPLIFLTDQFIGPVATLLALVPPLGGFMVVAQMLREYKTCIQIPGGRRVIIQPTYHSFLHHLRNNSVSIRCRHCPSIHTPSATTSSSVKRKAVPNPTHLINLRAWKFRHLMTTGRIR